MVSISGEAGFKVCGLCSQLVDTSVDLDEIITQFLSQFLSISPDNFPPKICTDCFSSATEAKRFKEHCIKAIQKIKKTRLSTSVILGKDVSGTPRSKSPSRKSLSSPRSSTGALSPSKDLEQGSLEELQVQIPYTERSEADKKFEEDGCSYLKKKSETTNISDLSSPSKKQEPNSSPKSSNSNRKRPSRIIPRTERTSSISPPKKKSKGSQGQTQSTDAPTSLNSSQGSTELDTAEVFPSIGPYQCEICQKITDTKQEFVEHIKELHRSVVDEEVLESLEQDLKKVERRLQNSQIDDEKVKEEEVVNPPFVELKTQIQSNPTNQSNSDEKKGSEASQSCSRCSAVLSSAYSIKKHQKTKSCRNFVKNTLDINSDRFRNETLKARTCQYCAKVVSRSRDLEGHQASKYCSAIRAEKEKEASKSEKTDTKESKDRILTENGSTQKEGNTSTSSSTSPSSVSDSSTKDTTPTYLCPSQKNEFTIASEPEKNIDKISLNNNNNTNNKNNNNNTQEAKSIESTTADGDGNGSKKSSTKKEVQDSKDKLSVINS